MQYNSTLYRTFGWMFGIAIIVSAIMVSLLVTQQQAEALGTVTLTGFVFDDDDGDEVNNQPEDSNGQYDPSKFESGMNGVYVTVTDIFGPQLILTSGGGYYTAEVSDTGPVLVSVDLPGPVVPMHYDPTTDTNHLYFSPSQDFTVPDIGFGPQ